MAVTERLDEFDPDGARWRQWQAAEPALADRAFATIRAELLDSEVWPERKDAVLRALLRLGRGDEKAKLAVVVCLLPGLRRAARRFGARLGAEEAWAEVVAAAWDGIGSYDIDRRPERIAANVVWDATRRMLVAVRAERRWQDVTVTSDPFEGEAPTCPDHGDPVADALAAGVVSPMDAALIQATRLDGVELATVGQLMGISYAAAKKRRRRAELAWAAWWAPEALERQAASAA